MKSSKEIRKFQGEMRRKPTWGEAVFNKLLGTTGVSFKKQVIIGLFIADFVIPSKMIIFEIDGSSHKTKELYDANRDSFLRKCGFQVFHIPNIAISDFRVGAFLKNFPDKELKVFRSALGKANAYRGNAIQKARKKTFGG